MEKILYIQQEICQMFSIYFLNVRWDYIIFFESSGEFLILLWFHIYFISFYWILF